MAERRNIWLKLNTRRDESPEIKTDRMRQKWIVEREDDGLIISDREPWMRSVILEFDLDICFNFHFEIIGTNISCWFQICREWNKSSAPRNMDVDFWVLVPLSKTCQKVYEIKHFSFLPFPMCPVSPWCRLICGSPRWAPAVSLENYGVVLQMRQVGPACLALRVFLGFRKLLLSQLEALCVSTATFHPSN